MRYILCILLVVAGIGLTHPVTGVTAPVPGRALTASDHKEAMRVARYLRRDPRGAVSLARRLKGVASVSLIDEGFALDIRFRDGAEVLIPLRWVAAHSTLPSATFSPRSFPAVRTDAGSPGKALVLEPFATQLGLGPDAGRPEIDALQRAGFHVDVFRDSEVTVAVMKTLSQYAVVYMETHSNLLGDDVVVATGETDTAPYSDLYADHSLTQVCTDERCSALYNAFRSKFIADHLTDFPPGSMMFVNGCNVLHLGPFPDALFGRHMATLIGWDATVWSPYAAPAADFVYGRLARGDTVAAAYAAAKSQGVADGVAEDGGPAHLGYLGSGDDTLADALNGVAPPPPVDPTATATVQPTDTPTPTATATATPRPTQQASSHKKCKKGYKRVHGKCKKVKKHH